MRRFVLGAAALLAATIVLMPADASAYWRGPGWGFRPIYGPWVGAPVLRVAPLVALAPAPIILGYPGGYGYGAPYPFYGGYYGYYRYGRCVTDDGYGRLGSCDHP
jgi:hypothetical protein